MQPKKKATPEKLRGLFVGLPTWSKTKQISKFKKHKHGLLHLFKPCWTETTILGKVFVRAIYTTSILYIANNSREICRPQKKSFLTIGATAWKKNRFFYTKPRVKNQRRFQGPHNMMGLRENGSPFSRKLAILSI